MLSRPLTSRAQRLFAFAALVSVFPTSAHAAAQVIEYYDFGSTTTGTAPSTFSPTTGTGSLAIFGPGGATIPAANVMYFSGTTINAQSGDVKGAAVAVQGGTGATTTGTGGNNGGYLQLTASATGLSGLTLSFATQNSGTGFNSNQLSYSTNGGATYTLFGTPYVPATSFALQSFDLSSITALNNNASDIFRITLNGATAATGNNRFDNLTLVGTPGATAAIYNYNNDGSNFSVGFTAAIPAAGTTTADTVNFGAGTYSATDDLTVAQPLNANILTFANTGVSSLNRGAGQNLLTLGGTAPTVTLNNTAALTVNLDVALAADTTFSGSGAATISGTISGSGGLTKTGAGTLTLSHANTYTGLTLVGGGTLQMGADNAIASGGSVQLAAFSGGTILDMNGHNLTLDMLTTTSSRTDATAQVNGSGTLTVGAGNSSFGYYGALGAVNSGALALVKNGTGTVVLGDGTDNNYGGGTTVNGGTLQAGSDGHAFGAATGALTVNTGGTLDLNGYMVAAGALKGTGGTVVNSGLDPATLTVGNGDASGAYAGVIADGANAIALAKSGAGTQTLTGTNTYTGGTTISGGAVSGPTSAYSTGNVVVNAGATADYTQNAASTYAASVTGNGSVTVGANPGGNLTGGGTITYTGVDSAAGGTTVKAGTLFLSHTGGGAALTGPVAVASGGIVSLGSNNQIASSSPVTLAGGTLALGGHSEGTANAAGLGTLKLSDSTPSGTASTLDFGDANGMSPVTLAFADSSSLAWTGTVQLTNYTDGTDQLYIGTTGDLTTQQLSDIKFGNFITKQSATGKITFAAAPEPSGWVSMIIGLLSLGLALRRRAARTGRAGLEKKHFTMTNDFVLRHLARISGAALAALIVLGTAGHVFAQPRRALVGGVPRAVAQAKALSAVSGTQTMRLALTLPLHNQAELDDLLRGLYDPTDPRYGHFLTRSQFIDKFCPTLQDYHRAYVYAQSLGLTVVGTYANRAVLDVSGPASVVEHAFGVHLKNYQSTQTGRVFFAPDTNPSIDASMASVVTGVVGLDNATVRHPHLIKRDDSVPAGLMHSNAEPLTIGSGPSGGLAPSDIKTAYNLNSVTQTGTGQTLALYELDGYKAADITFYENYFGLPNVPLQNVLVDGATGTPRTDKTRGDDEVTLDIELQIALAPGAAKIIVYEAPLTGAGPIDLFNRIASDNLAKEISTSWGATEDTTSAGTADLNSENTAFQQMAAQGQSIFAASGDSGAYDTQTQSDGVAVDDPASQPYMVGVGGTSLTTAGAGGAYTSETTWNGGSVANGAGGGGISKIWNIPSWQQGLISTASKGSTTKRNVPDVSLDADPNTGYAIYYTAKGGTWTIFGGTSCAAPLWSAFAALVNQKRVAAGNPVLGFANPPIYALASGSTYGTLFHDIANGSTNLFYPAVTGYDEATGWGTFNGANLLNALSAITVTATLPAVPASPAATAGDTQVTLTWTASSGALSYNIYRGTTAGGESATAVVTGVTAATYTNTGLTDGTTYYYKITAVNAAGQSAQSVEVNAKPAAVVAVPAAPASLTATAGAGKVTLAWTASTGATTYNVYRGTAAGGESATALATGITTATYADTSGTGGTTYFYKVSAVNTAGESAKSTEASAAPTTVITTQLMSNTGFENGSTNITPWVGTSGLGAGIVSRSSAEPAHGGRWDAWLCGYGVADTDTLYQPVTIPAATTTATLTFWLHIDTSETSTTRTPDSLAVQVRSSTGAVLATLATYTNLDAARGYTQKTFDLSAYAGQTVQIYLVGSEDSRYQTSFVVDDFSLLAQ